MNCPRCGFPTKSDTCELCGQSDFSDFEMARYRGEGPKRFEITLSFPDDADHAEAVKLLQPPLLFKRTSEHRPRYFVLFRDGQDRSLIPFLRLIKPHNKYLLLVNGRPRDYIEELWLPILEMLAPPEPVRGD